jgi:hypothetical protein
MNNIRESFPDPEINQMEDDAREPGSWGFFKCKFDPDTKELIGFKAVKGNKNE